MSETAAATLQRYLSYQQASEYTGLSISTLRRAVEEGRLPACRPSSARILFDKLELDRFVRGSAEDRA